MAVNKRELVQNPGGIETNPVTSDAVVSDEFIDPPSLEKSNRVKNVPSTRKKSTQEFFDTLYTVEAPVDQNSYEAALGFLVKKGFSKTTAGPIAKQLLNISYYSKQPLWYWLKELDLLPDETSINLKIMQILNSTSAGSYYLGVKGAVVTNPYVARLLVK